MGDRRDGTGARRDDQIMLELRILFEEQHERLAKRIEGLMSQDQEPLFNRLRSPSSKCGEMIAHEASISTLSNVNQESVQCEDDMQRIDSHRRTSHFSVSTVHLEEARQDFHRKELEDEDYYRRATQTGQSYRNAARSSVESNCLAAISQSSVFSWRRALAKFLLSSYYEVCIGILILSNAVYMGCELAYMVDHRLLQAPIPLQVVNHTYAALFTLELMLRILAEGSAFVHDPSRRGWNFIDTFLVLFSLLESAADIYQSVLSGDDDVKGVELLGNVRAIRVIRITRLLRMFRVARIVRFVRALRTLIFSIMCTLKSLSWAMLLLLMIIYVFALVFTQAATNHLLEVGFEWPEAVANSCGSTDPLNGDYLCVLDLYWGSLSSSMFTMFKAIVGGLSWDIVVQPFHHISVFWEFIFFGFISFTYLAVLNVVTGVFCQSAWEGAQHDKDIQIQSHIDMKETHTKKLRELFHKLDADSSGVITYDELTEHIHDPEVQAFFDFMELNTEDAWTLFKLLDRDQSHAIEFDEFVESVFRLRGDAKSIDMAKLLIETKWIEENIKSLANYMHLAVSRLCTQNGKNSASPRRQTSGGHQPWQISDGGQPSVKDGLYSV